MEKHLIVSSNKNFKVHDWTPFENHQNIIKNLNIIYKDDLICTALDRLNSFGWKYRNSFSDNKYIYFVLTKLITPIKHEDGNIKSSDKLLEYVNPPPLN